MYTKWKVRKYAFFVQILTPQYAPGFILAAHHSPLSLDLLTIGPNEPRFFCFPRNSASESGMQHLGSTVFVNMRPVSHFGLDGHYEPLTGTAENLESLLFVIFFRKSTSTRTAVSGVENPIEVVYIILTARQFCCCSWRLRSVGGFKCRIALTSQRSAMTQRQDKGLEIVHSFPELHVWAPSFLHLSLVLLVCGTHTRSIY